ncbi:DUF1403 family protein [Mesorhizobium opportunistum]|uniref:DUF1403 family protein n=1 Tax=Mesorhizobium opportunistum TaxID=593909 RepID=UPI00333D1721
MAPRANHSRASSDGSRRFPVGRARRRLAKPLKDTGFLSGAALAVLHDCRPPRAPLGILRRQRLALSCAATLARQDGRSEDEATLRDH